MSEHRHDEMCDCGDEHEEEVIYLTDSEGQQHEMVVVYTFEAEDRAYAVLLDRNEPEADGVIFRLEEEGEEIYLIPIEDDAEWERVSAAYEQISSAE